MNSLVLFPVNLVILPHLKVYIFVSENGFLLANLLHSKIRNLMKIFVLFL